MIPLNTADLGTDEKAAVLGVIIYNLKTLIWDLEMGGGIGGRRYWEGRYLGGTTVLSYHRGGPYPSHIKNGTNNINMVQNECLFYIYSISPSFQCLFVY